MIFALSAAYAGALNVVYGLVPLLAIQFALRVSVPLSALGIPILLPFLLAMIASTRPLLATLAVQFTDVLDLTNVPLMLIGYLTPALYPFTTITDSYHRLFFLDPMFSYLVAIPIS